MVLGRKFLNISRSFQIMFLAEHKTFPEKRVHTSIKTTHVALDADGKNSAYNVTLQNNLNQYE